MNRRSMTWIVIAMIALVAGCSPPQVAESKVASSEKSVADAIASFAAGDAAKAEQAASQAIDGGGLPADLFVQALMVRAAARGSLGSYDTALADLDQAAQGAGEMEKVHVLRSLILTGKGDTQAAAAVLAKAKEINKNVKVPTDLKKWDFSK